MNTNIQMVLAQTQVQCFNQQQQKIHVKCFLRCLWCPMCSGFLYRLVAYSRSSGVSAVAGVSTAARVSAAVAGQ